MLNRNDLSLNKKRGYLNGGFTRKRITPVLLLLICLIGRQLAWSQSNEAKLVPFNFTVGTSTTTSAGVFTKDGVLVRTLWSGKTYSAGTYTEYWDRLDDDGRGVGAGNYDIKVLSNNVQYQWEGVIANTSTYTVGSGRHMWTDRIYDMRIIGNYAYFVAGYQEGQPSQHKFNLDTPGIMEEIWTNTSDINGSGLMSHVLCNDDNTIYWAGYHPWTGNSCVWATSIKTGAEVKFSSGKAFSNSYGRSYASVLDIIGGDLKATIKGIAVSDKFIFVARPAQNNIHVLNKTTGAVVKSIGYTAPRSLFVDNDNKLWMVQGKGITKHTINADGTLSNPILTLTGLSDALSLQVSPDNKTVLIGDGGANHVYKGFSNTTGELLWTIGKPGGYSTSPDVSYDKFTFRTGKEWRPDRDNFDATFGAVLPNGAMWLGDMGNQRLIHFSDDRTTVMEEIMGMGYNYEVAVDRNNPTRVFCNYLEFEIDYSKPLQVGNNSWKLKRNWAWNVDGTKDDQYYRTRNIATLSNGKTYNIMRIPNAYEIVEYTATGMRYTGMTFPATDESFALYADGSLWSITNGAVGGTIQYKRRLLTGFDSKDNPQFGPAVVVEKTPTITTEDPVGHAMGGWNSDQYTSSNIMVTFATEVGQVLGGQLRGLGYHLGGLKNGKWLWKTSKSTTKNYSGLFPADGSYDIGNSVTYSGNIVTTLERSIFWGYNGEFWKASQTNKYNHYYDNGLLIGQFGVVGTETGGVRAYPGFAGNSRVWGVAKVGDDYYMYHADESQHGALHRWKISNLNSIEEQVSSISLDATSDEHGLTAQYFDGSDLNNFNVKTTRVDPVVDFNWKTTVPTGTAVSNPTNFSVRWEGYVQPIYSEKYNVQVDVYDGVRVWFDGKLVIDKWTNTATSWFAASIALEAGKRYPIRIEYKNANGASGVALSWSSSKQPWQKIPTANLYPAVAPDRSGGFDLMEGVTFNSSLQNGLYGWSRNPANDYNVNTFNYWKVVTSIQTLNRKNPDMHIELRPGSNGMTATVTRDLGTTRTLAEWSVSGKVIWPKDDEDYVTSEKGYFEILDINGKTIARIYRTFEPYPTARLYGNDKILIQDNKDVMGKLTTSLQPFSIAVKSSQVTFQYGPYAPVTTTVLDPASKWQQPKTLRILYYSKNKREHIMDIADMRFSSTPGARIAVRPALSGDDVKNTLSVAHESGTAEILVSENGESYKAYAGVINVGDVDRPAGYWKFKVKGKTNQTESDEVVSPAFTGSIPSARSEAPETGSQEVKLTAFPNPVQGELQVLYPTMLGVGSVALISADGKELKSWSLEPGSTKTSLDVSSLSGGVYFVKYTNGVRSLITRFIKQ